MTTAKSAAESKSAPDSKRLAADQPETAPVVSAQVHAILRQIAAIEREIAKVDQKLGVATERQETEDAIALEGHRRSLTAHLNRLRAMLAAEEAR